MGDVDQGEFLFDNTLDTNFLQELFQGDFAYAETVFQEFLKDLPAYWEEVAAARQGTDVKELGRAVHKCKTLFGYVGLTQTLDLYQRFENGCTQPGAVLHESAYSALREEKDRAQQVIAKELVRLQSFNAANG
jgi:HPt (histidine-containing phosphotransfer) domain-containing protein